MPNFPKKRKSMLQSSKRFKKRKTTSRKTSAYDKSNYLLSGTNPRTPWCSEASGSPIDSRPMLSTLTALFSTLVSGLSCRSSCITSQVYSTPRSPLGGQPTYFDQLALVYGRYIVNGAKVTCTFSRGTTTTANVGPYLCGIQTSDSTSLPTTAPGGLISSPNCVSKFVTQDDGSVPITQTYSKRQTYPDFDSALQARTNADPTLAWYAKVFAGPQGVDIDTPINVMVIIEFNATFSDLKQVIDA